MSVNINLQVQYCSGVEVVTFSRCLCVNMFEIQNYSAEFERNPSPGCFYSRDPLTSVCTGPNMLTVFIYMHGLVSTAPL
jgi:hypothetical protein